MAGAYRSGCRQSDEPRFGLWVINLLIMLIKSRGVGVADWALEDDLMNGNAARDRRALVLRQRARRLGWPWSPPLPSPLWNMLPSSRQPRACRIARVRSYERDHHHAGSIRRDPGRRSCDRGRHD